MTNNESSVFEPLFQTLSLALAALAEAVHSSEVALAGGSSTGDLCIV